MRSAAQIGAHVSVAGGLSKATSRAAAACAVPVFVHAPYLINFGSPSPQTLLRSAAALGFSLRRGAAIDARGVVLHAGSAVLGNGWDAAMVQAREHVGRVLDSVPHALASDATSLGAYLDAMGRDERIGVCLDTCHMHAAGHDLSTPARFAATSGRGRCRRGPHRASASIGCRTWSS